MNLINLYNYAKTDIISKGYEKEIEWVKNIKVSKELFFKEYVYVVVNSGMKNQIAQKIYDRFWENGIPNFNAIGHPHKNKSIQFVYNNLDKLYAQFEKSYNKLMFIREKLPHIGDITKYHLARNLGLDYAKPDRHLVRISNLLGYGNNVQKLCEDISKKVNEKVGVIDLILWRFAVLNENYLELLEVVSK